MYDTYSNACVTFNACIEKINNYEKPLSHGSASEETDKYEEEENPFPLPDKVDYEESLRPKNAVKKKILEVGEGGEKPESPDLATISYRAYFTKSLEVFDSGEAVEISLDSAELTEGFRIAVESMRKGEESAFYVKPKYAFKKVGPLVKMPKGFEELGKKSVTYDIKLLEFKKRADLNQDGNLMKTFVRMGKGYRRPKELDEVKVTYEISQDLNNVIRRFENVVILLRPSELGITLSTLFQSMKVGEVSICYIKKDYYSKNDQKILGLSGIDLNKDLHIKAELHEFFTVEDYYNDKSTLKKTLRSGKVATAPGIDSFVEFKIKLLINNEIKLSNLKLKGRVSEKKWEFAKISEDEDAKLTLDVPEILKYRLDEYRLPPLLTKILKEMNVKEIVEVETTKLDKMLPYFPDTVFDKELVKSASCVRIYLYLVNAVKSETFATLKINEKRVRVLHIKEVI